MPEIINKLQVPNSILSNSTHLEGIDCSNIHWVNNDASFAFANFTNLINCSNIGNTVSNIAGMFAGCTNLISAPYIPASVKSTSYIQKKEIRYAWRITQGYIPWSPVQQGSMIFTTVENLNEMDYTSCVYYKDEYMPEEYAYWQRVIPDDRGDVQFIRAESTGNTGTIYFNHYSSGEMSLTLFRAQESDVEIDLQESEWKIIGAFSGCSNLTQLPTMEDGIENIDGMYSGCESLESINLQGSMNSMERAFSNCYNLTSVEINAPVESMANAFDGSPISDVVIGSKVKNLNYAFPYSYNLANVYIETENSALTDMNFTFLWGANKMTVAPNIPNSVINMFGTFQGCQSLTSCRLPDNLVFGVRTFNYCSNLTSIDYLPNTLVNMSGMFSGTGITDFNISIPNSVTDFSNAFQSSKLVNFNSTIPNSVTSLSATFSGTNINCTNLVIPNSIINMANTFSSCKDMKVLPRIPDSVQNLYGTFSGISRNNAMTGVFHIPNSVTNMYGCFQDATLWTNQRVNITIEGKLPETCTDITWAFAHFQVGSFPIQNLIHNKVTKMESAYSNSSSFYGSVTVPLGVISVANTFFGCSGLDRVYLHDNITNMYHVFAEAPKLIRNTSEIPDSVTDLGYAFGDTWNTGYFGESGITYLPSNIRSLAGTFCYMWNDIPRHRDVTLKFPDSCTNMQFSFYNCRVLRNVTSRMPVNCTTMANMYTNSRNLISFPRSIPSTMYNVAGAFQNCKNVTGNIYLESCYINSAKNFITNTKAVTLYYPKTYQNGVNTTTYNTMKARTVNLPIGSTIGNVTIKDLNELQVTIDESMFTYNRLFNQAVVINSYTSTQTNITLPCVRRD